jgi:hypothetical protein
MGVLLAGSNLDAAIPKEVELGRSLSKDAVATLEAKVKESPNDARSRYQLLGYYFLKDDQPEEAAKAKHICWLLEHDPESELAGSPFASLHAPDDAHYFDVERLWLEQVKNHPDNLKLICNAVNFFFPADREEVNRLAQLALKIDPKNQPCLDKINILKTNPEWDLINDGRPAERGGGNPASKEGIGRFYQLDSLARNAFKRGETQLAVDLAGELLQASARYPKDWNYGNAVHNGNMIIGLAALKSGDRLRAADYLIRAGNTPGSPQANSFGPNMTLAKRLLEAGEKEAVLEYFKLCRKFWKLGQNELDLWTKEVEYGKMPAFGVHLVH